MKNLRVSRRPSNSISKIVYKRQSSILHRKAKTSLQEP